MSSTSPESSGTLIPSRLRPAAQATGAVARPGETTAERSAEVVPPEVAGEAKAIPAGPPVVSMEPFPFPGVDAAPPMGPVDLKNAAAPYRPPPPRKVQWFGFSTLLFCACCVVGYLKFKEYQLKPPAPPAEPAPALKEVPASANPITAFKQAKAIIKDAGEKHKAAFDTVEAMLDNPAAPVKAAVQAAPASPVVAVEQASPAKEPEKPLSDLVLRSFDERVLLSPAGSKEPAKAFVHWAQSVKIGGLRGGAVPRVLIGQTAYKPGDLVQAQLGIVFQGFNDQSRELRFGDKDGAVIIIRR